MKKNLMVLENFAWLLVLMNRIRPTVWKGELNKEKMFTKYFEHDGDHDTRLFMIGEE